MLNLAMLEDILNEAGCESVATAATIDQAIALIDERLFDAALLDIKLKGEHTYAVADALAVSEVPCAFVRANRADIEPISRPTYLKPFKEEVAGAHRGAHGRSPHRRLRPGRVFIGILSDAPSGFGSLWQPTTGV
jgi:CheY-like chemotaxis protein